VKTYTKKELAAILTAHDLWLKNLPGGHRADLTRANLTEADLTEANLTRANLTWADLTGANLTRADLTEANLITFHFYIWNGYATSRDLRIGCEYHPWGDWKKHGKEYAEKHGGKGCVDQWVLFWPVVDAMRKSLQKRYPVGRKKP
jgi:hypothetical protein